ncbi:growth-regulated protein homolog gamma-like isoform X2 [Saccopteryx bilineata]|uniref:growth-regulated protein homolog gamma-like isoform X2 n=1 Tax=Saccopteryx bilineata TaxID=59482 RepID=UPI00338F6812
MARAAATAAAPRAPRLLSAALLLLLLVAACRHAAGAPVVSELRCQCLQTSQGINVKNIQSVKVTQPGPHCAQTEVIATLKNGQEVCLNPAAPMVKKIVHKMLNKGRANRPGTEEEV